MEDATATATDWRQAWRAFADKVSHGSEDTDGEVAQAAQAGHEESREETFRGFGSPQGKF